MPIPSVEDFKQKCDRGFGHYKSGALDTVIDKLRLYHASKENAVVRDHILIELRDAVNGWANKHDKEFAARHGSDLRHEVMAELAERPPEHLKLVDGDILFRWVPRGIGQRNLLQAVISMDQCEQDERHRVLFGEGFNLQGSAFLVQHVGIYAWSKYAGGGMVVEIGRWGLESNPVADRQHYDLVVRSRKHGQRIAEVARLAREGPAYTSRLGRLVPYPIWDLELVTVFPHAGARLLWVGPHAKDSEYQREGRSYVLQQRVICSHFVNAVLYAAVERGRTLATATDHHFDGIFKVSPAQMWKEFRFQEGVWAQAEAVFVGVQHRGHLDRNIDSRSLGVGLTTPPVPKKAGRPPLPQQAATAT